MTKLTKMLSRQLSSLPKHQQAASLTILLIIIMCITAAGMQTLASKKAERLTNASSFNARKLAKAKRALLTYSSIYDITHSTNSKFSPGYLPCPATNSSDNPIVRASGSCGSTGQAALGLLAYRSLAISPLNDYFGNCFWLLVSGRFKSAPKSLPLNWDSRGGIRFRGKDYAALVIAPGQPLTGQVRMGKTSCATQVLQYDTSHNYLELLPSLESLPNQEISVLDHGNDQLIGLTSAEIFDAITRQKRFIIFVSQLFERAKTVLKTAALPQGVADESYQLISLADVDSQTINSADTRFFADWRNQFVLIRCTDNSPCLTLNGNACATLLAFAGRPRPQQIRQQPIITHWDDFFESPPTGGWQAEALFNPKQPSADVLHCLSPEDNYATS